MKILYYVGTGSNKFGGFEKFNIALFNIILNVGDDLVVVYRRPISNEPFDTYLKDKQVKTYYIYEKSDIASESKWTTSVRLSRIISKETPDLVHYNFGGVLLNPFRKFKAVWTIHCDPDLESSRYLRTLYGIYTSFCDYTLGVSKAIGNQFRNILHRANSATLYLGVPENHSDRESCREKFGFNDGEVVICNIAYHDRIKGVDVLINAINYLKNEIGVRGFRVIQVGGAPFSNEANLLKETYDKSDISDCFEFWGLRNDVEDIMVASDIYCQPSRSAGIPLSIMEAGMASLPIVATNVGGIPEVARDSQNAILCEKEDYKAIAQALRTLIENPEMRIEMGRKGYEISSSNFNRDRQAQRLYDLYYAL